MVDKHFELTCPPSATHLFSRRARTTPVPVSRLFHRQHRHKGRSVLRFSEARSLRYHFSCLRSSVKGFSFPPRSPTVLSLRSTAAGTYPTWQDRHGFVGFAHRPNRNTPVRTIIPDASRHFVRTTLEAVFTRNYYSFANPIRQGYSDPSVRNTRDGTDDFRRNK